MNFIKSNIQKGVLTLTLNRPEKFNSFCRDMALQLQTLLEDANTNTDVRCIVLTGEGKAFCAGQDLSEAIDDNGISISQIVEEHYNPIILKLRKLEKPVIAAVNGVAAGAGANIALACDIVVAHEAASFIQAFSKIGLIPDSGGTYFLPRLIGMQKATALMMTGQKVDAASAQAMGMIYTFYTADNFATEVEKLALQLANMPTKALALTKKLLNGTFQNTLESQLHQEGNMQLLASESYDYQEGVNAFLEKRSPLFKGE
ncbi:MAG: enoyl-CoA hydratase-related protein [Chitinophagaceae bacterium]